MAEAFDRVRDYKAETFRGAPGFYQVAQRLGGAWTLIDPEGRPFFACAVNGVHPLDPASQEPVARLRSWRFNTLGLGSASALRDEGLAWVASANFSAAGTLIHAAGVRLPDVFDGAWAAAAMDHAELACAPLAARRDLLGWLTDDDLHWGWMGGSGRPSLLQTCLSLEPSFAAYHAAWEFVLAAHGGRLSGLAKAWELPMENKEVLRELTRTEQGIASRGYLRDDVRWMREFAQRYFAVTLAAISAVDPNHLVLGLGRGGGSGNPGRTPPVVTESFFATVDLPWVHWRDLPSLPAGPVLAGDFTWVEPEFWTEASASARRLTSVERMLRRGRAALRRVVAHPAVVGYAWNQWRDELVEQPPFAGGLVHLNDGEAREHTELVADINAAIPSLRTFA